MPVLLWPGIGNLAALLAGIFPRYAPPGWIPCRSEERRTESSAGQGERRLLRAVTLGQTALTLALLVGAGLLIRTMMNISNVQSGYNIGRILTMTVTAVEGDRTAYHRRALERVSAIPGVQYAAFAWGVPLTGNNWPATVIIEGQPAPIKDSDRIAVPLRSVTENYFSLLGLPILDGRNLRASDDRKAPPVAVVNQALATRYFPHEPAIGKKSGWVGRNTTQ